MRFRRAGAAALAAALLALAGCGDGAKTGEVTGTVTIDGQPAESGAVTFIPADGQSPTAGGEIKAGKYTATVPVGVAKVEIRVPKVVGKKKLYPTPDSPEQPIMQEVLPAKYNDNTELTFDVRPGTNEKNWDLKTK
jgi:hypothetical protein